MIDLFPFSGLPVAVLGLGREGLSSARALHLSGAEVWAWDEAGHRRAEAEAAGIPLRDLAAIDWREPTTLVVEHDARHCEDGAHELVAAARGAGCEVVSDSELLARAQRDAGFVAVVSHALGSRVLDICEHVFGVTGREAEVGGDEDRPVLDLAPLELGGVYVLAMPAGRAALTVSITFDCAAFLGVGETPSPPFPTVERSIAEARGVFRRQTSPKTAVVNFDDRAGKSIGQSLSGQDNGPALIPISTRGPVAGGIYFADGVLYDARRGPALPIVALPGAAGEELVAVAAYAIGVSMGVADHAAMASVRSFFES